MTDTEAEGPLTPPTTRARPSVHRARNGSAGVDAPADGQDGTGGPSRARNRGLPAWARLASLVALMALVAYVNPWMLVVILAILVMVFMHELGHYLTAKRAGMKVTEFFIGFGPRLWSFKRGETEYGVKLIPAGAYVKIIGMHNLEEVLPEDEGRTYRQKSFGRRLSVAVAGSTMHFLMALVLIFVALVGIGQPGGSFAPERQAAGWEVGNVVEGSGAEAAGVREGDKVTAVAGTPVRMFTDLKAVVTERKGDTVPVAIVRHGRRLTLQTELRPFSSDDGSTGCCLGIGERHPVQRLDPLTGLLHTPREFGEVTALSIGALGKFFTPSGISNYVSQVARAGDHTQEGASRAAQRPTPSGRSTETSGKSNGENRLLSIYGLVRIGTSTGQGDAGSLIGLFALINIFIGVFNLVPLLPFDGGHVAVAVYEKIQERRLHRKRYFTDVAKLLPLTYAVVMLLGMIFVSSLYLDIANPITLK